MDRIAEINARLAAMKRPDLGNISEFLDADSLGVMGPRLSVVRREQNLWDLANPGLAAEHRALVLEAKGLEADNEARARARAEKDRARAQLLEWAGARVVEALESPTEEEPLKVAREWWASDSWCLAFIGNVGTGKSVGAGWCALQSLERGCWTRWVDAREAGTSDIHGEKGRWRAARLAAVPLLVVDDLGSKTVKGVEHWLAWLDGVLTMRHARHSDEDPRRTIITSNDTPEKFKALVGDRMLDRMREGGVLHAFGGKSLRGAA